MKEVWKFIDDIHEFSSLPPADIPEIVFWGRSNVGKSSLINSLTQSSIAKTSKTPCRTRSLVFFQLEKKLRIVDFPGYGFSKISKKIENKLDSLIDQYLQKRKCIEKLFLLVDSNLGFKDIDKIIINQLDVILKDKVIIVFTKRDRIKNNSDKEKLKFYNDVAHSKFKKKFFNASIKDTNDIILLKKFMMLPLVQKNEIIKNK